MTTIGSTAYYSSTGRYGRAEKSDNSTANTYMASQQESRSKSVAGGDNSSSVSMVTLKLQGKLVSLYMFDLSNAKPMNISALPQDQYNEFMGAKKQLIETSMSSLESEYSTHEAPDLSNYAGLKPYAHVVIAGNVVATIDNQGVVRSDDTLGKRLRNLLAGLDGVAGPDLAQKIAEQIANLVGGRIQKASTALTQRQFNSLPPIPETRVTVDYVGMKADPRYAQIEGWKQDYARYEKERAKYLRDI
ncbi:MULTISPECIES: hypothetical protein [Agrobacterium]|jgi:hypothetical protein|uniref:hypothetical protein n=1 Tax=Agrobacterium TaxID=357 RepID=UPI0022B8100D|nr:MULTISPECIES: hypothetical protein [Agrobacterium]MCZ7889917.1 hypothetical protein [Agrobacterium salinitolerans]MDA5629470.1 hypothetical protein [Agrobacterium sp. ST15.16.055]MDA6982442.1 hypothetical protein [Agrobacterium salinitolerans]